MTWTNPRCGDCGLFTSWAADSYVPMGCANPEYPEPYDPEYLCSKCEVKRKEEYIWLFLTQGLPSREMRAFYSAPRCWSEAKAIVRAMRKHGTPVPIRHHTVKHEYGYMRPEWEDKGTRIWCACGWNTGWVKGLYYSEHIGMVNDHVRLAKPEAA